MEGPLGNEHQVHFSAASPVSDHWEHWHYGTSMEKVSKVAESASHVTRIIGRILRVSWE
jgi:hypothetical protein